MKKSDAIRLLVAAQDDPVLASWAAVAHEHKASAESDASPYEYWEAFQQLFDYGLVSADQFNSIDQRREFFSGRRIPAGAVQRVLSNLKLLPERYEQEISMSRPKIGNPFADDNALVARDSGGTALNGRNGHGPALPAQRGPSELGNPFSMANEALPQSKRSLELDAFNSQQPVGLPCRDTQRGERSLGRGTRPTRVVCGDAGGPADCDEVVVMEIDDMIGGEGPDDSMPGGQVVVLSRVMHGQCRRCGTTHHHSAGAIDINDVDR